MQFSPTMEAWAALHLFGGAYNRSSRPAAGQLKSTSPGLYRLPYFFYTGRNPLLTSIPAEEGAGVEEGAGEEDVSLV